MRDKGIARYQMKYREMRSFVVSGRPISQTRRLLPGGGRLAVPRGPNMQSYCRCWSEGGESDIRKCW
jgi:hypothetical protein